jgi:N-acetyl-1-D-myo-inositol-2-amino-2-deoxy-alpha-D-glucopyranoside deacetylase
MAALGVTHEVLGEDRDTRRGSRYRDSGMAGTPSAAHPRAFVNADPEEAAELVRAVVRRLAPAVVVTYDREGGYRHPDHIQTHRVTCAALAPLPESERPALYAVLTPRSWAHEDRRWLSAHPPRPEWSLPDPDGGYPPSVVEDELVTHELVVPDLVPVQARALREHRTQVTVADDGLAYALSNNIAARLPGREGYALLDPDTGDLVPGAPAGRRHTDLLPGGTP